MEVSSVYVLIATFWWPPVLFVSMEDVGFWVCFVPICMNLWWVNLTNSHSHREIMGKCTSVIRWTSTSLLACENSHFSSFIGTLRQNIRLGLSDRNSKQMRVKTVGNLVMSSNWSVGSYIVLAIVYEWQTNEKKTAKVKCKRNKYITKQSILTECILL